MAIGVEVRTRTAPPSRGAPTETDMLFVASKVGVGSTTAATYIRSLADYVTAYGDRAATGSAPTYDFLDAYFREGGKQAYVGRYTTDVANALALFPESLGPGQVAAPEETPGAATFGKLLDHAAATNRFALMDVANNDTVVAMTTLGGAIPVTNTEYGALFGPWVNIPGPAGVIGASARQVPASAIMAGLIARADAGENPNRAAAFRDFPLQYVDSFVRTVTDAERNTLMAAGVNMFAEVYGVLQMRGFQTAVDQTADNPFWQANVSRTRMWIVARAKSAGEHYVGRPIDGRELLARALAGDLEAMLLGLYEANGLYGETPQKAFSVTVNPSVNTVESIAQGELRAVMEVRPTLHATRILIDLVTVPLTGAVSTAA
jgi:hypothetical protein